MKDLKTVFNERKTAYFNRSSAIFPVRLREGTDLVVSFLNYFLFKNNVTDILCNIRIYDADGSMVYLGDERLTQSHYEFSAAKLLGQYPFDGMLEIEFISLANLRFSFPAVLGFYVAQGYYSVVHSAGRIKASHEGYTPFITEESNFSCKYLRENGQTTIAPFIHIFNGPARQTRKYTLTLRKLTGEPIAVKELSYSFAPFASHLIEVANEFEALPEDGFFCSIKAEHDQIFPRFVCGNVHYGNGFMEATHSYPVIEKPDYCESSEELPVASFLPLISDQALELDAFVFPTNFPADLEGKVWMQKYGETRLSDTGTTATLKTGIGGGGKLQCPEDTMFMLVSYDSHKAKVPTRINTSYRYAVKGCGNRYTTDIATGTTANVYPQKFTHWGAGVISTDFHPIIMIRNSSHNPAKTQNANFTLKIFVGEQQYEHSFSIAAESASCIRLKDAIPASAYGKHPLILHWMLKADHPVGETFWVSYTDQGAICAEHGF